VFPQIKRDNKPPCFIQPIVEFYLLNENFAVRRENTAIEESLEDFAIFSLWGSGLLEGNILPPQTSIRQVLQEQDPLVQQQLLKPRSVVTAQHAPDRKRSQPEQNRQAANDFS
jgi:hypothetical protein